MRYRTALVGNVDIIDDEYVVVFREGTHVHHVERALPTPVLDRVERYAESIGAGGWVVPDLCPLPIIYR